MGKKPFISFDAGYTQPARALGAWNLNAMAADYLDSLERKLRSAMDIGEGHIGSAENCICPSMDNLYRAFEVSPPDNLKVIILGQDPYPNQAHATGVAFGVPADTKRLPGSLLNIIYEAHGHDFSGPLNFDAFDVTLESWARQGTLLLNMCLTTEPGASGAHEKLGWQLFTEGMLNDIGFSHAHRPLVIMLWGKKAQEYKRFFNGMKHLVLEAPHPSPLSAHTGFIGCRHFEIANEFLRTNGLKPINWTEAVS